MAKVKNDTSCLIRVYDRTRRKLKMLAAMRDESMAALLEELVSREWEEVQKKQKPRK